MTTSISCLGYVRTFGRSAQEGRPDRSPIPLAGGTLLAPPPFVTGELLALDRFEQAARLVGAQLVHRFALRGAIPAARHRADGRVGRALVAGHVVVSPPVVSRPSPPR